MPKKERLAKRAEHQAEQEERKRQQDEQKEAERWQTGAKGKSKKDTDMDKKAAIAARKAENAALLAEEEKTLQKSSKGGGSGSVRKSSDSLRGAAKVAARKEEKVEIHQEENKEVQVLAASNIDDALDLMTHVSSSAGSAGGKSGASLERHPERRAKAAYASFEEKMLPQLKQENSSLRLSQLKEILWKLWQKSPDNPFNQSSVSYRASKEEEREVIKQLQEDTEQRLRIQ